MTHMLTQLRETAKSFRESGDQGTAYLMEEAANALSDANSRAARLREALLRASHYVSHDDLITLGKMHAALTEGAQVECQHYSQLCSQDPPCLPGACASERANRGTEVPK